MPLTQQVPPIARGYHYALQLHVTCDDTPFPGGSKIVGQLRDYAGGPLAGQLSSDVGSLYVDNSHTIELQVPATISARLGNTTALLDFVRTDAGDVEWLGIQLRLPVIVPATVFGSVPIGGIGAGPAGATTAVVIAPPDWAVRLSRCPQRTEGGPVPSPAALAFNSATNSMYLGAVL